MTRSILAHFDGKVIVPDEPVDLPLNEPLRVELALVESAPATRSGDEIEERLRRLQRTFGCVKVPSIPLESMRREELYDE